MSAALGARAAVLGALLLAPSACSPAPPPRFVEIEPAQAGTPSAPVEFDLGAIDGSRVTSEGTRNRSTIFVFVATYDLASFAQVKALGRVLREHRPRVNGVAVALDPVENRALVQAFAAQLPFPVVHADATLRSGRGPLPVSNVVPSVAILDREGRIRFRYLGLAEPSTLERALKSIE